MIEAATAAAVTDEAATAVTDEAAVAIAPAAVAVDRLT
jgi:hypothetical protein